MAFRKLLYSIILLFIFSTRFVSMAQDNPLRLRDLADANDMYIGAAVYTSHLRDPLHGEVLSTQFNMLTPENEAKFCELQPQRGRFDFTALDELVAFAEEHNM